MFITTNWKICRHYWCSQALELKFKETPPSKYICSYLQSTILFIVYITSNIHHVFIALEIWPFYLIELWRGLGSILKLPLSMIVYCSMPSLRNFHSNGDIIFTSAFIRGANVLLIWRKNFHTTPARAFDFSFAVSKFNNALAIMFASALVV